MKVTYFNKQTKYNTQFNNLKRKALKFAQYAIVGFIVYMTLVVFTV